MRFVAAIALLLGATQARAYVQTRTDQGNAVRWPSSCIIVQPDARGDQSSDKLDIGTINTTLANAVANWNSKVSSCTFMRLGTIAAYQALDAASDGRPAVVFRAETWGRGEVMYDARVIGLTTVWYVNHPDAPNDPTDGQISDADIELNAVSYTFSVNATVDEPRAGTMIADLENTLTHELGHVFGLAHTCWDHAANSMGVVQPTAPLDNTGQPALDCLLGDSLPPAVKNATMYPYVTMAGSTSMRNLSADDIAGICDVYPIASTPTACYGYIESRGCEVTSRTPAGSGRLWLVVLGPVAWLWLRKRRGIL